MEVKELEEVGEIGAKIVQCHELSVVVELVAGGLK